MPFQFRESFQLQAPIDRVWDYLADPRQVVTCLPGTELVSVESATSYRGRVKVKVGPVTAAYDGTVTLLERDDQRHIVRMRGEGRETTGGGSASMTMTSILAPLSDGGTRVDVVADIELVGRIVQFGRGMIESVNKQLFRQFTTCVTATLERPVPLEPAGDQPAIPASAASERAKRPVHVLALLWAALLDWLRGALSVER